MGKSIVVRDPAQLALWTERIGQCQNSGQQVSDWCSENDVSVRNYYYWHSKIQRINKNKSNEQQRFYDISSSMCGSVSPVASIHINTDTADIYRGADEETIASIIRTLKSC